MIGSIIGSDRHLCKVGLPYRAIKGVSNACQHWQLLCVYCDVILVVLTTACPSSFPREGVNVLLSLDTLCTIYNMSMLLYNNASLLRHV